MGVNPWWRRCSTGYPPGPQLLLARLESVVGIKGKVHKPLTVGGHQWSFLQASSNVHRCCPRLGLGACAVPSVCLTPLNNYRAPSVMVMMRTLSCPHDFLFSTQSWPFKVSTRWMHACLMWETGCWQTNLKSMTQKRSVFGLPVIYGQADWPEHYNDSEFWDHNPSRQWRIWVLRLTMKCLWISR